MLGLAMFIVAFAMIFTIAWKYIYTKWFVNSKYYNVWKRIDKHNNILRITSVILCLVCIGLYFGLRWALGLENVIKYHLLTDNTRPSEFRSANISIVFMLDLCSFVGILILFLKIFDNKKKVLLKPVAYLAVLGGYATLFFTVTESYLYLPTVDDSIVYRDWDPYYFFFSAKTLGIGDSDEPLMFLMHLWMVVIGVHTVVWESRVTMKEFCKILACIILYAIYIYSMSAGLHLYTHVTAIVEGDFMRMPPDYYTFEWDGVTISQYPGHPSYSVFIDIYGCKTWQAASVVTWITFAVIVILVILLKNTVYYFTNKEMVVIDTMKNQKMLK